MNDFSVGVLRTLLFDFVQVFACFAAYLLLGKILLTGHWNSLPSSFNTKVFLAFPFEQLCQLLDVSIESLFYRQEAGLGCILLVITNQLLGCFSFQFPLTIPDRKGCVNGRYFLKTRFASRWDLSKWSGILHGKVVGQCVEAEHPQAAAEHPRHLLLPVALKGGQAGFVRGHCHLPWLCSYPCLLVPGELEAFAVLVNAPALPSNTRAADA